MFLLSGSLYQQPVQGLVGTGAPTVSSRVTIRILKQFNKVLSFVLRSTNTRRSTHFRRCSEHSVMRLEDDLAGGHDSARSRPRPIIDSYPGAVMSLTQQGVTGRVLRLAAHQGRQELPLKYFNLRLWKSPVWWRLGFGQISDLTSACIPMVTRVNYGWCYGCFLRDLLDTLTIVISWVKILEIVTRHFAIVPIKKTFKMKSMTERTISRFLCWLDEPSRLNAQQNWFFSIWFFHLPLENVQFSFERREERGLSELFFHFFFTKWPSSCGLSGKYEFFFALLKLI